MGQAGQGPSTERPTFHRDQAPVPRHPDAQEVRHTRVPESVKGGGRHVLSSPC